MNLYRIFPFDVDASNDAGPGGPLFVPRGGYGRVDNRDSYRTFYVASTPEAAVAESFGRFAEWTDDMLYHPGLDLPLAIASYTLSAEARIFDLNDVASLGKLSLRPSDVVVRDTVKTQAWALRIFEFGAYDGISWWSFYGPQWACFGVWNIDVLSVNERPRVLKIDDVAITSTAQTIAKLIR